MEHRIAEIFGEVRRVGVRPAGDQYAGLDRFGRIIDQRWTDGTTDVDRYQYGYDRAGNRTYRENTVNSALSEVFSFDGLNQLTGFERGTLNGNKDGITGTVARSQDWDYDALGNWNSVTTDGGSPETRTHNRQNEITAVSGATTPTYDANGNMTRDETGKLYSYDPWNRLLRVREVGGSPILAEYNYDALGRRAIDDGVARIYSANWQVLEERSGSQTTNRYVWSPVYVDAMVARDRDTDANGTLDERLYPTHDANFNVTALLNTYGAVVERMTYDPFGKLEVRDAAWAIESGSSVAWIHLHQGGRLDVLTELYHFRNREYSPTLGRWVTMDPIRFEAGDVNLYRYVGNGPASNSDPLGLQPPPRGMSGRSSLFRTPGTFGQGHLGRTTPPPLMKERQPKLLTGSLSVLSDSLQAISKSAACRDEAKRIAAAIINTHNNNEKLISPFPPLTRALGEQKYKGYFCYEWAYGFEDAARHESSGECFTFAVESAHVPNSLLVHAWLRITSTETGQSVYVDDNFMKLGQYVHISRPEGSGYVFDPKIPRGCDESHECDPPRFYDSKNKLLGKYDPSINLPFGPLLQKRPGQ